jgi:hypothetical protein
MSRVSSLLRLFAALSLSYEEEGPSQVDYVKSLPSTPQLLFEEGIREQEKRKVILKDDKSSPKPVSLKKKVKHNNKRRK